MPADLRYERYTDQDSMVPWVQIADVFVECFSSAPYLEDVDELKTILEWGPTQLGDGTGVLVTASREGRVVGFALAHGLAQDQPWQEILAQLAYEPTAAAALQNTKTALVLHELAVVPSERGQGIAGACLAALLQNRPEARTFIGVYQAAADAAAMYQRWQATEIGQVPMPNDAIALRVLTAPTSDLARRTARQ